MNFHQCCVHLIIISAVKREISERALAMVNWFSLLARAMLPNQSSGPRLSPTQNEYQNPGYNPQQRSLFPVSSSNPFLNNRMMVMMMLEKMRANRVSGTMNNKNRTTFLARAQRA